MSSFGYNSDLIILSIFVSFDNNFFFFSISLTAGPLSVICWDVEDDPLVENGWKGGGTGVAGNTGLPDPGDIDTGSDAGVLAGGEWRKLVGC